MSVPSLNLSSVTHTTSHDEHRRFQSAEVRYAHPETGHHIKNDESPRSPLPHGGEINEISEYRAEFTPKMGKIDFGKATPHRNLFTSSIEFGTDTASPFAGMPSSNKHKRAQSVDQSFLRDEISPRSRGISSTPQRRRGHSEQPSPRSAHHAQHTRTSPRDVAAAAGHSPGRSPRRPASSTSPRHHSGSGGKQHRHHHHHHHHHRHQQRDLRDEFMEQMSGEHVSYSRQHEQLDQERRMQQQKASPSRIVRMSSGTQQDDNDRRQQRQQRETIVDPSYYPPAYELLHTLSQTAADRGRERAERQQQPQQQTPSPQRAASVPRSEPKDYGPLVPGARDDLLHFARKSPGTDTTSAQRGSAESPSETASQSTSASQSRFSQQLSTSQQQQQEAPQPTPAQSGRQHQEMQDRMHMLEFDRQYMTEEINHLREGLAREQHLRATAEQEREQTMRESLSDLEEARNTIRQLQAASQYSESEFSGKASQVSSLRAQLRDMLTQTDRPTDRDMHERVRELEGLLASMQQEYERLKRDRHDEQLKLASLLGERALSGVRAGGNIDHILAEIRATKESLRSAEHHRALAEEHLLKLQQQYDNVSKANSAVDMQTQASRDEWKKRAEQLQQQCDTLAAENRNLQKQLRDAQSQQSERSDRISSQSQEFLAQIEQLRTQVNDSQRRSELNTQKFATDCAEYERTISALMAENSAVKAELDAARNRAESFRQQHAQTVRDKEDKEFEAASVTRQLVEERLKVTERTTTIQTQLQQQIIKLQAAVDNGRIELQAVEREKQLFEEEKAQLEEEVKAAAHRENAAVERATAEQVAHRERLSQLQAEIDALRDEKLQSARNQREKSERENELQEQLSDSMAQCNELTRRLGDSSTQNTSLNIQLTQLQSAVNDIKRDRDSLQQRLQAAQDSKLQHDAEINEMRRKLAEAQRVQSEHGLTQQRLQQLTNQTERLRQQLQDLVQQHADEKKQAEAENEALRTELHDANTLSERLSDELQQARSTANEHQRRMNTQSSQHEDVQMKFSRVSEELRLLTVRFNDACEARNNLEQQLNARERTTRDQQRTIENLQEQVHRLEERLSEVERERDRLVLELQSRSASNLEHANTSSISSQLTRNSISQWQQRIDSAEAFLASRSPLPSSRSEPLYRGRSPQPSTGDAGGSYSARPAPEINISSASDSDSRSELQRQHDAVQRRYASLRREHESKMASYSRERDEDRSVLEGSPLHRSFMAADSALRDSDLMLRSSERREEVLSSTLEQERAARYDAEQRVNLLEKLIRDIESEESSELAHSEDMNNILMAELRRMARVMEQQEVQLHGRAETAHDASERLMQLTQLVERSPSRSRSPRRSGHTTERSTYREDSSVARQLHV
eukprot:TRINITY_DN5781_c1_g1_i2.p1 TRINITY_DN5781_c1_g1~~TRINITY_DN5781_c1_g1_i2.p1  ORF type:complete len:1378 (+),score=429.94 TRINITY_DN5781_c1_g1_i2:98-4231(+)